MDSSNEQYNSIIDSIDEVRKSKTTAYSDCDFIRETSISRESTQSSADIELKYDDGKKCKPLSISSSKSISYLSTSGSMKRESNESLEDFALELSRGYIIGNQIPIHANLSNPINLTQSAFSISDVSITKNDSHDSFDKVAVGTTKRFDVQKEKSSRSSSATPSMVSRFFRFTGERFGSVPSSPLARQSRDDTPVNFKKTTGYSLEINDSDESLDSLAKRSQRKFEMQFQKPEKSSRSLSVSSSTTSHVLLSNEHRVGIKSSPLAKLTTNYTPSSTFSSLESLPGFGDLLGRGAKGRRGHSISNHFSEFSQENLNSYASSVISSQDLKPPFPSRCSSSLSLNNFSEILASEHIETHFLKINSTEGKMERSSEVTWLSRASLSSDMSASSRRNTVVEESDNENKIKKKDILKYFGRNVVPIQKSQIDLAGRTNTNTNDISKYFGLNQNTPVPKTRFEFKRSLNIASAISQAVSRLRKSKKKILKENEVMLSVKERLEMDIQHEKDNYMVIIDPLHQVPVITILRNDDHLQEISFSELIKCRGVKIVDLIRTGASWPNILPANYIIKETIIEGASQLNIAPAILVGIDIDGIIDRLLCDASFKKQVLKNELHNQEAHPELFGLDKLHSDPLFSDISIANNSASESFNSILEGKEEVIVVPECGTSFIIPHFVAVHDDSLADPLKRTDEEGCDLLEIELLFKQHRLMTKKKELDRVDLGEHQMNRLNQVLGETFRNERSRCKSMDAASQWNAINISAERHWRSKSQASKVSPFATIQNMMTSRISTVDSVFNVITPQRSKAAKVKRFREMKDFSPPDIIIFEKTFPIEEAINEAMSI